MGITARITKRTAVIGSAIALTAVGGGIAFAAWTSNGSGTGQAAAATAQSITVAAVAPTPGLYPGASGVEVHVTLTNPNPYPVHLTNITAGAFTGTGGTGPGSCTNTALTFSASTPSVVTLGAHETADRVVGTLAMGDSDDGCQGATFTSTISVIASS